MSQDDGDYSERWGIIKKRFTQNSKLAEFGRHRTAGGRIAPALSAARHLAKPCRVGSAFLPTGFVENGGQTIKLFAHPT
jgi:hypothetical protein